MILGSHLSTAGGVKNSLILAKKIGCEAVQIFTKNQRRWDSKELDEDDVREFLRLKKEYEIEIVFSHASYLLNLASGDENLRNKSITSLLDELKRAKILKLPYVVIHPGAHKGIGEIKGIDFVVDSINRVVEMSSDVKILIETTAGQGSNLGYKFWQIGKIIEGVNEKDRVGCCLDTCHIFAAGYDFSTLEKYESVMEEFEREIGIEYLLAFHLNDSLGECGSRKDRHTHIGEGFIGLKPFSFFLNDTKFKKLPGILETPKDRDYKLDVINLKRLRELINVS